MKWYLQILKEKTVSGFFAYEIEVLR